MDESKEIDPDDIPMKRDPAFKHHPIYGELPDISRNEQKMYKGLIQILEYHERMKAKGKKTMLTCFLALIALIFHKLCC